MSWYETTDNPEQYSWAESAKIRAEFQSIEAAFGLLPDISRKAGNFLKIDPGGNRVLALNAAEAGLVEDVSGGTGVQVTGESGDLTVALNLPALTATSTLADASEFVVYHDGAHRRVNIANLKTGLGVPTVTAGEGIDVTLSGNDFTVALDIDGLTSDSDMDSGDLLAFYDGTSQKVITHANFRSSLNLTDGSGTITSIIAGNGMSGGGSSGDVTVNLNLNSLSAETDIADTDTMVFTDVSDSSANKKITFSNIKNSLDLSGVYTFSGGLSEDSSAVSIDISGLTAVTEIADDDLIMVGDTSDSSNAKKITKTNLITTLGIPGTTVQSVVAGDGLSGGGTGAVTVALNIHGVANTETTIDDGDFLAFADISDSNSVKKITKLNLRGHLGIVTYTGGDGISIDDTGEVSIDVDSLTALASVSGSDYIAVVDDSEEGKPTKKATITSMVNAAGLGPYTGGTGVDVSDDTITVDLTELPTVMSIGSADTVVTTVGRISVADLAAAMRAL